MVMRIKLHRAAVTLHRVDYRTQPDAVILFIGQRQTVFAYVKRPFIGIFDGDYKRFSG